MLFFFLVVVFFFFLFITSEIFQQSNRYTYQFVGEVITVALSIKEIIQHANVWIYKEMKNAISISLAINDDNLIRNENIISKERKTKTI